jgi:tachylectin
MATLLASSSVRAQNVKVNIPGGAFTPRGAGVAVDDAGGGRRFRGAAFALVTLQAKLQIPSASLAEPRLQRLVIRFRTSAAGPSLRAVELWNGSHQEFRRETNIEGDFATRETAAPNGSPNTWDFSNGPWRVGSDSVLRLDVQYPGGFDSAINPGDFVMLSAQTEFVRKPQTGTTAVLESPTRVAGRGGLTTTRVEAGPVVSAATIPTESKGVIYAVSPNKELQWYRHTGRGDGTFNWAASTARTVGHGWGFRQIVPADDGVIYAITADGTLLWYRHDGRADGSVRWAANTGKNVGSGWIFEHVFAGPGGVIYAITSEGDLLWYRHDGREDGSVRWAANTGRKIGSGWTFEHVFAGDAGVIYAVTAQNELLWYRHDGYADGSATWAAPNGKPVGTGWAVRQAFSGGDGVIYAVMENGDLLWNRHDGRGDGTFRWAAPTGKKVGIGWIFDDVFAR